MEMQPTRASSRLRKNNSMGDLCTGIATKCKPYTVLWSDDIESIVVKSLSLKSSYVAILNSALKLLLAFIQKVI
jgi:hypothetical protein